MKLLRKFWNLRKVDFYFLFVTFLLLGVIRLGLWLLEFRILLKIVNKLNTKKLPLPNATLGKIIWAVNVTTRYMPGGAKCLARALTTQILMNHSSFSPELCIGVAKGHSGELEAHAWIKYQGYVVIGYLPDLPRYIQLPSLEGIKL
ncbi:lasso peptide biosynthesis B2 protein [Plectonema cf. radiosum LEGE 06105]|uniref:Lasso peptide biosynthesis B2 protein n=1 Tax=Plectonema cf. radiosum LEGE 06105 TaxID=945769 RepID=A0A8J7FBE2_9CYAN|nr:lasso peptide biosynthesis B2 protein [Plectonema radiosum]MBE9213098.1 lasso peptide biosynthesis B2 protein [Plectonema cf. radiosum LEGE 06105]